jgi:hypothetical protein
MAGAPVTFDTLHIYSPSGERLRVLSAPALALRYRSNDASARLGPPASREHDTPLGGWRHPRLPDVCEAICRPT